LDERGFGKGELLPKWAVVRGRPCKSDNCKSGELDESGSRENLERRPANAGLFISFGDGGASSTRFGLLRGFSRWPGKRVAGVDEQDDYLCPWSILRKESGGRSWAINNTSNVSGVERK
jgi:hypothetical protein